MLKQLCSAALVVASLVGAPALAQDNGHAEVSANVRHDTLKSLRHAVPAPYVPRHEHEHKYPSLYAPPGQVDGALQTAAVANVFAPLTQWSFTGIGNDYHPEAITGTPPDTVGAVGATQYVQVVNGGIVVFDKTTRLAVYGPVLVNTLWSGFGGDCQNRNDGDAVVVYDKAADRWIVSQFAVPTSTGPSLECVAVSQTSDATGGWYRYAFSYTKFDDYPKMGVWPDAYYVTFNMFGSSYVGAKLCAYDRGAMLTGAAATQQCFQQASSVFGVLPADLDGSLPPPANARNYLMSFGSNSLKLWKFHVDWAVPANTTLTGPTTIPVAAFTAACSGGGTCIPQPGGNLLDSLADRLMFRIAYRNFGDHESLLVNHTVDVSGIAEPRWYEIRNPGGTPSVYQQGTYAPDATYRWMGSIAMDRLGDIALGYSASSSTLNPGIRYTGRLAGDPLGTLQAETSIIEGAGTESVASRWGDYSAMTIDPVDDCTFWYTTEYYDTTGKFTWGTRIASLVFPGCQRRYVNSGLVPSGIHDGKSWSTAYLDLQSALADAACCEVWVAAGVYKPTATADRTISFSIRPGLTVYGGFAGSETKLSQRDPIANPTVLSGDIDNNDTGQNGIDGDTTQIAGSNSYHVVVMDGTTAAGPVTASTILDGFTITGGAADGAAPNDSGGGLLCNGSGAGHACNATLSNLHFAGNFSAYLGGGLYNNGSSGDSSPVISATTFSGNQSANGGAAFQDTNASTTGPTYVNDTFFGNSAGYGAAMYNRITSATGAVTLTNVTTSGNASGGGAIAEYCAVGGSPTFALTNAILWGDAGPSGSEEVLVANCALLPTFKNSVVMGSGGSANWQSIFGIDAGGNLDVNPLLGQLQDNGGSTSTMLPGAGSPAIDTGLDSACAAAPVNASDQRGAPRPIGVHCDIGSVEVHQYSLTVNVSGSGAVSSNTLAIPSTSNGISACSAVGGTCTATYAEGAHVILAGIAGWHVATALTDSCGGSLSAGVFTTAALSTQTCTASLTLAQNQATTSVSSDVNPSLYGNAVTFTAIVSPSAPATAVPTGSVTFYDGGVPIAGCAGGLSGLNPSTATCSVPVLAGGSHSITVSYSGDTNYLAPQPGSTLLAQQVNAASQTITFGPQQPTQTYSQSGTFALGPVAIASSNLPVSYSSLTTSVCLIQPAGIDVAMLSTGTCTIQASQGGDGNYQPAISVSQSITLVRIDLQVGIDDGTNGMHFFRGGDGVNYVVSVSSNAGTDVVGATVDITLSSNLTGVAWTCQAFGGATCAASGSGDIADTINVPAFAEVKYYIGATVVKLPETPAVVTTIATIAGDVYPQDNSATATTAVGIFANGF